MFAQERQIDGLSQLRGEHDRELNAELPADAVHEQPPRANGLHVLLVPVDQHDVHTGPRQPGADQAADRPHSPDDHLSGPTL